MSVLTDELVLLLVFLIGVFVGQAVALIIWALVPIKKSRGSHEFKN